MCDCAYMYTYAWYQLPTMLQAIESPLKCTEKQWEGCFCLCSGLEKKMQNKHTHLKRLPTGCGIPTVFHLENSLNGRGSGQEWEEDERNVDAENEECSQAVCATPRWLAVQCWWVGQTGHPEQLLSISLILTRWENFYLGLSCACNLMAISTFQKSVFQDGKLTPFVFLNSPSIA